MAGAGRRPRIGSVRRDRGTGHRGVEPRREGAGGGRVLRSGGGADRQDVDRAAAEPFVGARHDGPGHQGQGREVRRFGCRTLGLERRCCWRLREVGGVRCDLHRPPYAFATEDCNQLLSDMVAHGIAGGNTTIVLERSARSDEPVPPEGWVLAEHRDYGETAVWYIESALETSEASETSGATDE